MRSKVRQFSMHALLISVAASGVAIGVSRYKGWLGLPFLTLFFGAAPIVWEARRCYFHPPLSAARVWVGIGACVLGVVLIPFIAMDAHPVPLWRLANVKPGMSRQEVLKILGIPTTFDAYEEWPDETWRYSSYTWCNIEIDFDSNGKVLDVIHDH
jgi:hypothetical protein